MSCVICKRDFSEEPTTCVRQKGVQTLLKCSVLRKDDLDKEFRDVDSITLHITCRRSYTRVSYNDKGEFKLLSSIRKNTAYTSLNEDYDTYTNYLLTEGNRNNFELENENSDLPANGVAKTKKSSSTKEEHIGTSVNFSVGFEPGSSRLSVKSKTDISEINYNPITIQDSSLPQIATDTTQKPDVQGYDVSRTETLRVAEEIDPSKPFPFEDFCFLCAKDIGSKFIQSEKKQPTNRRNVVYRVARKHTKDTVIRHLTKNNSHENQKIIKYIKDVDLVQASAGYHKKCMYNLLRGPKSNLKIGRPKHPKIAAAMQNIYKYIDETNKTNYTLKELTDLQEDSPDGRTVKSRLKTQYPGKIYFTSVLGYSTVVTIMKNTNKEGIQDEKDCLIWKKQRNKKTNRKKDEENIVEEKRKSLRITGTETKRKESIEDITDINLKEEEEKRCSTRITKKKKECNKSLEIKNEKNITEDDCDVFSGDDYTSPSLDGDDNITCEQNEEDYKNKLICSICLSSDRKLNELGEFCDMYWKICADVVPVPVDTKLFLVCWECRAALVHAMRFRARAEVAHRLLSEARPECLSTLSKTYTDITVVSCECEHQGIQIEVENTIDQTEKTNQTDNFNLSRNESSIDKCMETNESKDSNHVHSSARPVTEGEENMDDFNTFDDGWSDEEMDNAPDAKRPRRSGANVAKGVKENDEDEDDKSDKIEDSSSESSDSDWEETKQSVPTKRKQEKMKPPPLRFRIEIEDYDVDSKIRREPIAESELSHWLECERNSAYFKLSKRKKCSKCISEIPSNEDHHKIYHSKNNPLVCHICKFTCSSEAVLSPHIARHYFVLHCALCSYQCYNELHMRSHVHWHKKSVCCLDCHGKFRSMDEFRQHYEDIHGRAVCDHCGKQFPHKLYLETHIRRNHVPQVCTICNTTYKAYNALKTHMDKKHRVERTEAAYCVQCDRQFDNEKLLKQHVYTSVKHASERKSIPSKLKPKKPPEVHKCPECPNSYRNARSLHYHHSLVHERKITFYCKQCDKAFSRKSSLKTHMRLHEGYVPPKDKFCQFCGLGFSTRRILTHHIRTHTGERPFSCPRPHCGKQFAQRTAMLTHVRHVHDKVQRQGHLATSSGNTLNLGDIATSSGDMLNLGDIATSSGNTLNLGDIATSSGNMLNLDDIPF